MQSNSPKAPGMSWMIPCLTVADASAAADFYQKVFGFEVIAQRQDDQGVVVYVEMRYKDNSIMIAAEGAWDNPAKTPRHGNLIPPMAIYLYCEDVDAKFQAIKQAGVNIISEPEDMFWGDRMCRISDPDGYNWSFATHIGEMLETANDLVSESA